MAHTVSTQIKTRFEEEGIEFVFQQPRVTSGLNEYLFARQASRFR